MTDADNRIQLAAKGRCHTSLNLLLDESVSVTDPNWRLQVEATANAITHPSVLNAILRNNGSIALRANRFGPDQEAITDWHIIDSPEAAHNFANMLRKEVDTYASRYGTNIGGAMMSAINQFETTPCRSSEFVVDISTDGRANKYGQSDAYTSVDKMEAAKAVATYQGVVINGIAVGGQVNGAYLTQHVVTPGGFVLEADWNNYAEIIRQKLEREVAQNTPQPEEAPTRFGWSDIEAQPEGSAMPHLTAPAIKASFARAAGE